MTAFISVVRSASLNGYIELAQSLGLDAFAMLRRAGLSTRSLQDPETPLSVESVHTLLETSATASAAEDFGLRLAARRQLSHLGPIALVLREEPTARQALDTLFRYLRLLNTSLVTRLESNDGRLIIHEDILTESQAPMPQSIGLALGVMYRILRELLGSQWRPLGVCFKHQAPRDTHGYQAFFGTPVDFGAPFNGIVCRAAELEAPRASGNPEMARFTRQFLDLALAREQRTTAATVRQLITALLPGGQCTSQQVAQHLGVDRRTLHRHLAADGGSFSQTLQNVRVTLVMEQLRHGNLPLTEVAKLLGFGSPSAFSYWFSSYFGCSARQWRKANA